MKLSGNYSVDDLIRALQGNFNCQSVTKNAKGKTLDAADQHIRLELFFLRFELYKDKVVIYKSTTEGGNEKLERIGSIPFAQE